MNLDQYQDLASRTAKPLDDRDGLVHVALGLTGEAGEFADSAKRHLIYGQPFDEDNLAEELGDILWYVALGCSTLGISLESVAKENIAKLQARYPDRYTDQLAAARLDKAEGQ